MKNALTIDLEDYYQVSAFRKTSLWIGGITIPAGLSIILQSCFPFLMREMHGHFLHAGWVARKYPKLIRKIADNHHEIACHSNVHRSVYAMGAEEFREDTLEAKNY